MKQADIEKKILAFWKENDTFKKSVEKPAPEGDFVFYDGPPFATGTPHYGHIVASLIKDMVPRYFTMRGYRVERRWGWDCHGLPIENIVEKEHGFKHKKDILAFGVDKFNEEARSKVLMYVKEWREVIDRLGRWVDFDNDYKTMDPEFMESVWWVFKELYDKGLLYEAYRSMHICPRCETTLAQSEVAQGYKDVKDLSVVAKFKIKSDINGMSLRAKRSNPEINSGIATVASTLPRNDSEIYLLAWTTTPWTLPGNAALAIGDKIEYVKVSSEGQNYILAKSRLETIFKDKSFEIISGVKGKDLLGLKYKPLFPYYESTFKVYAGDFVNTEEGTGIVHIAPAFGEDDMALGKKEKLPFIQHVSMDGTFKPEVTDFAGIGVKHQDAPDTDDHPEDKVESTDVKIVKYLAAKGLLFSKAKYTHSYPHCWRCDSPLLNYATSSWFVAVEKIKKDLLKNAEKIEWMPEHIKEGRFGQWLAGARDWSISRQRFWGSVLPIWRCNRVSPPVKGETKRGFHNKDITSPSPSLAGGEKGGCGHIRVIGSITELEKLSGQKVTDLHKHFVDKITFKCKDCDGTMQRIPDVLDCWFESGSMPYTQPHFPAHFIAEGVDQTRAWFYYMHVLAIALKKKPAFKHVVVNGIVLAEDGKKMSKRLQNYPDPLLMFDKYGADAVRYYLATAPVLRAEDFCFSEKGVEEVVKKVLLILYNILNFYKMYESVSFRAEQSDSGAQSRNPLNRESSENKGSLHSGRDDRNKHVLDQWILAKLNVLIKETTDAYDKYDLNRATRPIAEFVNELSTWYLRRSRDRFKGDDEKDKSRALATLKYVLENLSKIMAPVMPFTAEHVWQMVKCGRIGELKNGGEVVESVHLQDWPKVGKIDKSVIEKMDLVRSYVENVHALRSQEGIKVRQPLSYIYIKEKLSDEFKGLLTDETNFKAVNIVVKFPNKGVVISNNNTTAIATIMTPELRIEGHLRELVRTINGMRKNAGLTPGDVIALQYQTDSPELKKTFITHGEELKKAVIASNISEGGEGEEIEVNGEKISIKIDK